MYLKDYDSWKLDYPDEWDAPEPDGMYECGGMYTCNYDNYKWFVEECKRIGDVEEVLERLRGILFETEEEALEDWYARLC